MPIQRLQNRVAAGYFQRFQNTELCSVGIGAEPQQAENAQIRRGGNERFSHMARHMHCLLLLYQIWYNE